MADDPKRTLKELEAVDKFNDKLDDVKSNLNNIASQLGNDIRNKFTDLNTEADEFISAFQKGEDITSKLNSRLADLRKSSNRLGVEQLSLADKYNEAVRKGQVKEQQRLLKKLTINNLEETHTRRLYDSLNALSQTLEEEKKITEEKSKQSNLTSSLGKALETNLGFNIKNTKEMFTLTGIMTFLIKAALQANTQSVALGKSLGYGADRADDLRSTFVDIERSSNNVNVNTKNLTEAFNELATSSGYVYEYSKDQLETQIKLTKQVGLSAEEASKINDLGVVNNKTSESTYKSFVKGLAATRNQLRVGIDFKATLAEAAKVSGQLAANLGYNPERIAKAIVTAKAFGMTLEQVTKSGESLLNFETSIDNELKAELLTGKALNLERARAAALSGDQVTLAEELAKNVGTAAEFSKMNVLQQKALAEAVGMTADELGNTLVKREQALKSGKSLAQINADEAAQAIERQTIQDKFNAAIEKLQSLIGNLLAGPLGTFLEVLADALSTSWGIYAALVAIAAIKFVNFKGLGSLGGGIGGGAGGGAGGGLGSFIKGINPMDMIKGAGAILILSGALFISAKAFQEFADVDWEDIVKGGVALLGLAGIAMILDKIKGPILQGAFAIAILGASLIPLGYALKLASPGIESFGKAIKSAFEGIGTIITAGAAGISTIFTSLQSVDVSKLLSIGPALMGIGIGLASLGAGSVIGAVSGFLSGDPFEKLKELSSSGDGLTKTATALQSIAISLGSVSSALASMDISKLDALDEFANNRSNQSIIGGITDFIFSPIQEVNNTPIAGENQPINPGMDLSPMISAINEVKNAIATLQNRPLKLYIDSKEISNAQMKASIKPA